MLDVGLEPVQAFLGDRNLTRHVRSYLFLFV
jgi:hypothetical protein